MALRRQFVVNGNVLDHVEVFKYLGLVLSQDNDDAHTVRAQIMKAYKCWVRIGKVLRSKNTSLWVCRYF